MEGSLMDLSRYRMARAQEVLEDAALLLKQGGYASSVNRSYYAIFNALRAVIALDGFDCSKHAGVIAYINKMYVKEGILSKQLSKNIDTAFRLREKADYDDFVIVSVSTATEQMQKAEEVVNEIKSYLENKWE